ncbi:MAG: DegV family protein [Acholeplasmatales bacterium]|nr:DegV family protein [Acholeplasmatales bacterium]
MQDYKIFIDLSADIDAQFVNDNNIGFVPMEYKIGEETKISSFVETDEVMKEFYKAMKDGKVTSTSQISPYKYIEFFTDYLEEETDILYLPLSSGLSQTNSSANMAKEELKKRYPNRKIIIVDTLSATAGVSILANIAVENKKKGLTIEENAKIVADAVSHVRVSFLVETLTYLKRGGRIKASTAFIAGALNIKPIIIMNSEGKLETIAKKHGTKKAESYLVEKFNNEWDPAYKLVYISHADCIDTANAIKEKLLEAHKDLEIKIVMISPIIGAHVGPGMCAICNMAK